MQTWHELKKSLEAQKEGWFVEACNKFTSTVELCKVLGIPKKTVYELAKKYEVKPPNGKTQSRLPKDTLKDVLPPEKYEEYKRLTAAGYTSTGALMEMASQKK